MATLNHEGVLAIGPLAADVTYGERPRLMTMRGHIPQPKPGRLAARASAAGAPSMVVFIDITVHTTAPPRLT